MLPPQTCLSVSATGVNFEEAAVQPALNCEAVKGAKYVWLPRFFGK